MAQERWTKQCSDGTACGGSLDGTRFYIPDDVDICDSCLLARYMPGVLPTYDGCGDPLAMNNLYREEDVIEALRAITGV